MAANAFVGRDVVVYYSTSTSETVPNDFVRLGAVRDKSFGVEWETVDSTADTTVGNIRTNLVTFAAFNPEFSGVTSTKDSDNLDDLEKYVLENAASQPMGWLRLVRPKSSSETRTYELPVIFTSFTLEGTYDDVSTWSLATMAIGSVAITDV